MMHLFITNRKGVQIILHVDALKEAFPTSDGRGTVCVISVRNKKGDHSDTFMVVNESTQEIKKQLIKIRSLEEAKQRERKTLCGESSSPTEETPSEDQN